MAKYNKYKFLVDRNIHYSHVKCDHISQISFFFFSPRNGIFFYWTHEYIISNKLILFIDILLHIGVLNNNPMFFLSSWYAFPTSQMSRYLPYPLWPKAMTSRRNMKLPKYYILRDWHSKTSATWPTKETRPVLLGLINICHISELGEDMTLKTVMTFSCENSYTICFYSCTPHFQNKIHKNLLIKTSKSINILH